LSSRRSSTVGFERRFNPALVKKPQEQWVRDLMADMPLAPPYFRQMKKINREGPAILGRDLPGQRPWSAKDVRDHKDVLILDVRSKEAFAAAHVPNSISIPLGPNLPNWAGWVLPYDRPLLIVADNAAQMPEIATHLIRVGFDQIAGFLSGGINAWQEAGYPVGT